jgi:FHS family glucose/mannose:H+ symporter-like MFS transporter
VIRETIRIHNSPITIHIAFVLTGATNTLLGPLLPVLVGWWGLADPDAGFLFTLQFAGSIVGAAVASPCIERFGLRSTLLSGIVIMATGVGALGAGTPSIGYPAVSWFGLGLGLTIPTTNLLVAETASSNRAAALSLLNFSWGVGAVAGPPAIALSRRIHDAHLFLFALAAALLLSAAMLGSIRAPRSDRAAGIARQPLDASDLWRRVLQFGSFLFLYVGTETSVSGWMAVYAERADLLSSGIAIALPSVFWGTLLAGRALGPWVLKRRAEATVLRVGLAVATAGVLGLLAAGSPAALIAAVSVVGLGFSMVFPVSFAIFTREMGAAAAAATGPVFVFAALGGASLPWLVGVVSARTGNLAAGLLVPLAGCAGVLILDAVLRGSRTGRGFPRNPS